LYLYDINIQTNIKQNLKKYTGQITIFEKNLKKKTNWAGPSPAFFIWAEP
jgi:hypothetical protein